MNAQTATDNIRSLVRNGGGYATDEYKADLLVLRRRLPAYCSVKLDELKEELDAYYSPRKHLTYPGGIDQLQVSLISCLRILEEIATEEYPTKKE